MNVRQVNVVTMTDAGCKDISNEWQVDVIDDIETSIDMSINNVIPLDWLDHKPYYDALLFEIEDDEDYDYSLDTVLEFV